MPQTVRDDWTLTDEGVNTALTITKSGEAGRSHYVVLVSASQNGGGSSRPRVDIKDGGTTIFSWFARDGAPPQLCGDRGLRITEGQTLTVTMAAAGSGNTGVLNVYGYTDDPA